MTRSMMRFSSGVSTVSPISQYLSTASDSPARAALLPSLATMQDTDWLTADEERCYEEALQRLPSAEVLMRYVRNSPPISAWDE